ncbi:phage tail tape measure protein [Crateriforma conspicua]|uniref:Phage-related minor tail protein n=1 Tax=Crateriforma conspicua TaxID=2527996 RepID=A0A5C6FTV9_9PLAN|nr:phage tail tape measure protein [Crateriforma conspicua]TWU66447.1 hypothetical protein V7x_20130 [Crateriforma conspicua]
MSQTTVEITGEARSLEATFDRLEKKQATQDEGYRSNAQVAQDSARQIEAANEAAANKGAATYNRILRELRKQGPEGREQAKAIERYLQQAGIAGRRSMESIHDELSEIDPAAAEAARSVQSIGDAADDTADAVENVGDQTDKASGPLTVSKISAVAGQWLATVSVIDKVADALQRVQDANEDAFDSLQGVQAGDRRLVQVADEEDSFQELRSTADRLAVDYGIDRNQARNLVFDAKSNGFLDSVDFIAQNQQVVDVAAMSQTASKVPNLFTGEDVGTAEALNMVLSGAAASNLDFEQLSGVLPNVAASGNLAGAGAVESIASLSVLAGRFKSGETASDRIKAFASKVNVTEGLDGMGIVGAVEAIQAMSDEDRKDFLKENAELNEAYGVLSEELDTIRGRMETIQSARDATGTAGSIFSQKRAERESDEGSQAVLEAERQRNRKEVAREGRAAGEGNRQARVDAELAMAEERDEFKLSVAMATMTSDALSSVGSNDLSPAAIGSVSRLAPTDIVASGLPGTGGLLGSGVSSYAASRASGTNVFESATPSSSIAGNLASYFAENAAEQRETNRLLREQIQASKQTAQNTKPRRPDSHRTYADARGRTQ